MRPGAASALDTQRRFARAGDAGPGTWASAWRVAVHSRHARVSAHGPHRPARPRPPSDSLPPPIYTCAPRPRRSPFWGSLKCPSKRRLHEPFFKGLSQHRLVLQFFFRLEHADAKMGERLSRAAPPGRLQTASRRQGCWHGAARGGVRILGHQCASTRRCSMPNRARNSDPACASARQGELAGRGRG